MALDGVGDTDAGMVLDGAEDMVDGVVVGASPGDAVDAEDGALAAGLCFVSSSMTQLLSSQEYPNGQQVPVPQLWSVLFKSSVNSCECGLAEAFCLLISQEMGLMLEHAPGSDFGQHIAVLVPVLFSGRQVLLVEQHQSEGRPLPQV